MSNVLIMSYLIFIYLIKKSVVLYCECTFISLTYLILVNIHTFLMELFWKVGKNILGNTFMIDRHVALVLKMTESRLSTFAA